MYHILLINGLHHKNENAIFKYNNINWTRLDAIEHCNDLTIFDAVFSPSSQIDVKKYPNVKFIFGPHFSVFPNELIHTINYSNVTYIQPSKWVVDLWKLFPICNNLQMKVIPFGVDTNVFCPLAYNKNNVVIYFKHRKHQELQQIISYLNNIGGISYRIFDYSRSYREEDYIRYLQTCKYGIWIDAHESQGFALEEALSCDVPLLVWNVSLLSQEENAGYPDVYATSIPYWDNMCGEVFYNSNEFENTFRIFLSKLHTYRPREYIINNLSIVKCEEKFIELLK